MSESERTLADIWAKLLRMNINMIGMNDSFFDLGGDSIRGNQMVFDVRKAWRGVDVSMNAIFRSPTLKEFAREIDRLRDSNATQANSNGQNGISESKLRDISLYEEDYATDARKLVGLLPKSFPFAERLHLSHPLTVFLTGATGFLGAYILRDLLSRNSSLSVVAHVRAQTTQKAFSRIKQTCLVGHPTLCVG